jgi:hypothetical protein
MPDGADPHWNNQLPGLPTGYPNLVPVFLSPNLRSLRRMHVPWPSFQKWILKSDTRITTQPISPPSLSYWPPSRVSKAGLASYHPKKSERPSWLCLNVANFWSDTAFHTPIFNFLGGSDWTLIPFKPIWCFAVQSSNCSAQFCINTQPHHQTWISDKPKFFCSPHSFPSVSWHVWHAVNFAAKSKSWPKNVIQR